MKKILVLMLTLIFSLGLLSSFAKNEFDGKGTPDSPYLIENAEDLTLLSDAVYNGDSFDGKYFLLTRDIVLNDIKKFYSWEEEAPENELRPIGGAVNCFKGIFEGNGKTIKGFYFSDTSKNYAGLFGYIKDAEIKNLNVEKSYVSGRSDVGLIVGIAENSKIENVRAEGIVFAKDEAGGIAGSLKESKIEKAISSVEVKSEGHSGGIAGYAEKSEIIYSASKNDVSGGLTSGGIAGHFVDGTVENAYSLGEISADTYAGGIVGYLPEESDISFSYAVGNIISEKVSGGIAGVSYGNLDSVYFKGFVTGEYKGAITGINSPLDYEGKFPFYGEVQNAYFAEDRCESAFGYTLAEEDDHDIMGLKASKLDSGFIRSYILKPFISDENIGENPDEVWTFKEKNPKLWFEENPIIEEKPGDVENPSERPEIGVKMGEVVSTDIRAYIEGKELKAVNIGGKMAIALKDLRDFGFEVLFDEEKREVKVSYKGGEIKPAYVYEDGGKDVGSYISDVLSTDITAYLDGKNTESFNAEGYTHVYFRSLELFGEVSFDEEKREAHLKLNK